MNRLRTDERKIENYRTVTEIVDAENSYKKEFDVTDLVYQNEAYLRKISKRELYLMISKYYVEVVRELNLPEMRILFSSKTMLEKVFSFVYYSLAFVNNQMVPHSVKFVDMKFVDVRDRSMSIPTEPIIFYKSLQSEDSTITCFIDTANILRILEKPVDVTTKFEMDDGKSQIFKMLDKIKNVEKKQMTQRVAVFPFVETMELAPKMNEAYVTQFVTLLILFSNAYLGLFKLMRSDFQQYYNYLLNHESLMKEQSLPNINNLILGHFSFGIDTNENNKRNNGGLIFKR
ncbi:odv-ec27 [Cryptophlebia leucotreta granulovirus]|uniref:Odv-ec27 n=1 Tax=Cryptophlebia leucotreta granulosis virus TaxID=35254 RepID=Q7T5K5_GVCL|nr:odv-ec27 [Cryptophlebia leucotreta granulovirus]AAQ21683.1 odv-ec27 [Cryptophlebia leucotreta granulovirus]